MFSTSKVQIFCCSFIGEPLNISGSTNNAGYITSAPRAVRVSMSTAVCVVMCRHPAIRAPFSGLDSLYIFRICIKPGISFSAISMHFRPHDACSMSAAKQIQNNDTPNTCLTYEFNAWFSLVQVPSSFKLWPVLRIYVALAIFQPYRDLEAGDNQSLTS